MEHNKFKILDVNISAINIKKACEIIGGFIREKGEKCRYICVAPVSTIVSCQEDKAYKEIVNQADMVTPDGMPVVWLGRQKGFREVQRTYGPDLMVALCDEGQEKGYRHYLYGGTEQTLVKLEEELKIRFPKIVIAGRYSPPFRDLSEEENKDIVNQINSAAPDVVWVGLGSPKQDFWMKTNCDRLTPSVMIGVGAAFDFLAGTKRQAPVWIQRSGLEWLFRFCCEPRRLWRRYLIGNSKFIYMVSKEFITQRTRYQNGT